MLITFNQQCVCMFYDVENHADKHAYETSQVNLNLHDTEATGYKKKNHMKVPTIVLNLIPRTPVLLF